jgi:hypothetical protein
VLKVLQAAVPGLSDVELLEVKDPALAEDLRHMEDRLLIKAYRFGVVYCKQGQTDENDMFSNSSFRLVKSAGNLGLCSMLTSGIPNVRSRIEGIP